METATLEAKKDHYFISDEYVELCLHIQSEEWKEVQGRAIKIPGKAVRFIRKPYRGRPHGRGELVTRDPEVVEFIRNHSYFSLGKIKELSHNPDDEPRILHESVVTGVRSTGARDVPGAPADSSPAPVKVKIGLSKPKK